MIKLSIFEVWKKALLGSFNKERKLKKTGAFYNTFLEPGELEVSVHEGAVGVSVAEVAVVVLTVARHRHPPVGPDTNWKYEKYEMSLKWQKHVSCEN